MSANPRFSGETENINRLERTRGIRRSASLALLIGCVAAAVSLSGCGKNRDFERVVVSGTVTYNGKPVSYGNIRFVPARSSSVPMTGAEIIDGKYCVNAGGGAPVGAYKVLIEAYRKANHSPADALRGGGLQQYIPEKYNAKTQLEITIPPGSRKITENFDLLD